MLAASAAEIRFDGLRTWGIESHVSQNCRPRRFHSYSAVLRESRPPPDQAPPGLHRPRQANAPSRSSGIARYRMEAPATSPHQIHDYKQDNAWEKCLNDE